MIFLTLCVILLSHNFCEKQLCDFDSTNCNGKHDINDQISYTCEWVNTYYYACLPLNDKNINCSLPSNESECDVGSCWGVNVSGLCVEVNEITLNLDDTITKIITENNESYSLLLYLKENTTNEEGGVAVVERSVSIYGYEVDNVPLVVIIPSNSLNFFDVGIGGVLKISYFTIMVENSSVERLNVSFIIINGDCSVVELKYCLVTIKSYHLKSPFIYLLPSEEILNIGSFFVSQCNFSGILLDGSPLFLNNGSHSSLNISDSLFKNVEIVNTSNVFGPDSVIVSIFTFNQIRIERCVFSNCSVQNSNPSNIAGFIYVVSSSSVGFHNNVFSLCNIVGAGSFICCMKNNNSNSGDETSVLELSNEHYSQCRLSGVVICTDYEIRLLMSSFSNLVSLLVEKESPSFPVSSLDPESGVLVSYSNIFITNSSFSNADGSYVILAYRDLTISDSWFKGTYSSIACLIIKSCFSVVSLKDLNFSSVSLGGGVIDLYGDDGYDKGLDLYGDDGYDKGQPSDDEDKLGGLSIRNCSLLDVVMTSYEDETLPGVFIRTRPSFLNSEAANEYLINLTSVYFSLTYELLPSMKINPVSLIDVKNVDFFIGNSELSNVISGSINSIRNSDENSTNTVLFAWSSAAVLTFSNCTTELRNVTIHSQRGLGAVSSVGIHSKLKLYNQYINSENETSLFDTSQGLSDSFSSAGMNVYCEGGGGLEVDGEREWSDGISLWIDNVDCAVVGKIVDYPSLLFVPSLKQITAEYAELPTEISENKTLEKEVKISYFGKDLFIHPDIKFAVGYRIKSERKEEYTEIILNEIVIINETFATHLFESNVFYIDKLEEEELEWVGWINFSNDYRTKIISISFLDAPPDDDGSASFIYPPLSQVTLIGIFVIGGLMVIIILFIIYALISKKLKKWWKNKNKEMLEENDNVDEKNTGIENLVDGDYVKQT